MIPVKRLHELLSYDPDTGDLFWKSYRNSQAIERQKAGSINNYGYCVVGIDNKVYQAHRVIWAMYYGQWPDDEIDHINRNRVDNRIANLRCVSGNINMKNKSKSKANSSGHTGVYKTKEGRWMARICVDRKLLNLGTYESIEEAVAVRKRAVNKFKFHPTHGV